MVEKGSFILLEYTLSVKDTGELVDTTNEEEARRAGIYSERERYGPRLIIVGEGRLLPGVEKALEAMEVGEEKTVEIPPEEAYGARDPSKVKILPRNVFIRQGVVPEPGKTVEIDGKYATIRQVTGGRVVVDFNHPLAGKTLLARLKIIKLLENIEEKAKHLFLRRVPQLDDDDIQVEVDDSTLKIGLNDKALRIADLQLAKALFVKEVEKYLPEVRRIVFIESISTKGSSEKPSQEEKE
ncbi:MAG: FKBP-type peptidyl-prolyl cis-trans isomerase [Pyrodictiaceae archaeon]